MATDLKNIVEKLSNLTVIEASELSKMLEEEWGVSAAAAAVAAAGPVAGPVAAEEKSSFDVVLTAFSADKKIAVIKAVRECTSLSLGEAKAFVEGAPGTIKEGCPKAEADEIKKSVEEAGGTIELK